MKFKSITFKLLLLIITAFAVAGISILVVADIELTRIVDRSQNEMYAEKVDVIWETLTRVDIRLTNTGFKDVYAEDFKSTVINELRKTYYTNVNESIYPFIVDADANVVMHPFLPAGVDSLVSSDIGTNLKSSAKGNFVAVFEDRTQWYTYRRFGEWGWVVAYTVPVDVKYADAASLRNTLLIIMLIISSIVLVILSAILTRAIKPIIRLNDVAMQIADGNLEHNIESKGADEIGTLARSFNKMKDAIKDQISKLNLEVSERRQAERKFRTLFESSNDAIILLDPEAGFQDCNPAALRMFAAKSKEEFCRMSPADLSPEHQPDGSLSKDCEKKHLDTAMERGEDFFDWQHVAVDGREFSATVHIARIEIDGRVIFHGTIRDISEQQKLEYQLRQSEKMQAIGQLAGGVAHDFNNLLGGIIGAAEVLETQFADNKKAKKFVDMIASASDRAAELTSKLLAFSRKEKTISTPVSVHEIVNETIMILERSIDKRITLQLELEADEDGVVGDPALLQGSILNLGVNARDAMPEGGKLSISTTNIEFDKGHCDSSSAGLIPGKYIQVSVCDTGIGISPDIIGNVFEPFFTTKEQGKGTGLGLAAVYGTIRNHKGDVTVYSELGEGTAFHLYLPIESHAPVLSESSKHGELPKGSGLILIVDDEEIIRTTAACSLEQLGYDVISAADGEKGLSIYQENVDEIDLVILDMIMPRMNGTDTFRAIRKVNPQAKVIIASGFTKGQKVAELQDEGLAGFIKKPFRRGELSKILTEKLG